MSKLWDKYEIREIPIEDGFIIEQVVLDMADDPNRDKASQIHLNAISVWIRFKGCSKWLNTRHEKWHKIKSVHDYINYITDELQSYVDAHDDVTNHNHRLMKRNAEVEIELDKLKK